MVSSAAIPLPSSTTMFTWHETSGPTSLLFPSLPHPLSLLPALFRVLAWSVIVPVAILALLDVFGWAYHIFVLRPLGYASTIRFKDPEPSTLINVPAKEAKVQSNSSSPKKPSSTSTGTSQNTSKSKSRSRTRTTHMDDVRTASSSPNSSVASSPTIEYQDLSSPPTSRSPSHSPSSSTATGLLPATKGERPRSSSTSSHSSTSSMSSIYRERAGSIGVEGPLLFEELGSPRSDLVELDEEEEEELDEDAEEGESSEDQGSGASVRRRRTARGRQRGVPRGGPSFGFTGMQEDD